MKQSIDRRLFRDVNFLSFWGATILSALGDSSNYILMSWFILDVTGSEGILGTALLCISIPRLFFMLIGGVTADRINRKYILIFSVLARALVLGLFSMLLGAGNSSIVTETVYLMATLFGIVDAFFWPARDSMIPQVVPKDQLAAANSIIQTTQQISMVVGPLLAAILLHLANYQIRFLTIAAVFLGTALLLAKMRFDPVVDHQKTVVTVKSSALQDLAAGIRYVITIRPIALIMVIAFFTNILTQGPLSIAIPVLVKNLGWSGSAYGFLMGAVGIGAIIGGIITGLAKRFRGHYRLLAIFIVGMGLGIATTGFMRHVGFGIAAMLVVGMMMTMVDIPIIIYIQTVCDQKMLGRVMSLLSLTSMGLGPVSYALTSYILQHGLADAQTVMITGGTLMAITGLSMVLFKDLRTMEEHPAWKNVGSYKSKDAKATTM